MAHEYRVIKLFRTRIICALVCIIAWVCIIVALSNQPIVGFASSGASQEQNIVYPFPGVIAVATIAAAALYRTLQQGKTSQTPKALLCFIATVLSACMVLGRSLDAYGNFSFADNGALNISVSIVSLIGFISIFYTLLAAMFNLLDSLSNSGCNVSFHNANSTRNGFRPPEGHVKPAQPTHPHRNLLIFFLVIAICWLPWIIVSFPGTPSHDFIQQLKQFYGATPLTNHHPVVITMLYGGLYEIGFLLSGCANGALFSVVLFQYVFCAGSFAFFLHVFARLGCPKSIIFTALAIIALCPIFPLYAQWVVKDTISAILLMHFIFQLILRTIGKYQLAYCSWPFIFIVGLLCSLSRNNCIFIVIPTLLMLLLTLNKSPKKPILATASAICICYLLWNSALPLFGIQPGNIREALALPLTQVTRAVDLRPENISSDELAELQTFATDDLSEIADGYSIQILDSIKNSYEIDKSELPQFLGVYLSIGIKNPDVYLSVALSTNFGYWYPYASDKYTRFYYEYAPITATMFSSAILESRQNDEVDLTEKVYSLSSIFPKAKYAIQESIMKCAQLPLTTLLFSAGFYIWSCFIVAIAISSKDKRFLFLCISLLATLLSCFISPLNGSIRYALPFVFALPILISLASIIPRTPHRRKISRSTNNGFDLRRSHGSTAIDDKTSDISRITRVTLRPSNKDGIINANSIGDDRAHSPVGSDTNSQVIPQE